MILGMTVNKAHLKICGIPLAEAVAESYVISILHLSHLWKKKKLVPLRLLTDQSDLLASPTAQHKTAASALRVWDI